MPRGSNHGGKSSQQQARLRNKIIKKATQEKPINAAHWSTRTLAEELNTTHSFVNRVLSTVGFKPHLEKTFKVSNDRHFEEPSSHSRRVGAIGCLLTRPEGLGPVPRSTVCSRRPRLMTLSPMITCCTSSSISALQIPLRNSKPYCPGT
jgi:hypothetical protein